MAKRGSADFGSLLLDGYDVLASKPNQFTYKLSALIDRVDGLGDAWQAFMPTGLEKVDITMQGAFFDDSANTLHAVLASNNPVTRLLTFTPVGNDFGRPFVGLQGAIQTTYDVVDQVGQLTKANATLTASGSIDRGLVLQPWAQKTITWNTFTDGHQVDFTTDTAQRTIPITSNSIANPSVVTCPVPHGLATGQTVLISGNITSSPAINGSQVVTVIDALHFSVPVNVTVGGSGGSFVPASSMNGGVGYQSVSQLAGITGFVGKIRDSPDNITYGDLLVFTNVTAAPAAERLINVLDTVVDRYLCYTGTVTGVGTLTLLAGFARN